jgi:hypothetical protein
VEEEDDSMQAVLDKAIERYRRERFLRDANADFAALKRNRRAWKKELKERELWGHTLSDGLPEEWTPPSHRGEMYGISNSIPQSDVSRPAPGPPSPYLWIFSI